MRNVSIADSLLRTEVKLLPIACGSWGEAIADSLERSEVWLSRTAW